jgi:hypothetical protein
VNMNTSRVAVIAAARYAMPTVGSEVWSGATMRMLV